MNASDPDGHLSAYTPVNPLPLGRRLAAAGLGSLAEEEQRALDRELGQLDPDIAELLRERLASSHPA